MRGARKIHDDRPFQIWIEKGKGEPFPKGWCLFLRNPMKKPWVLLGLLSGISLPICGMQARTPQAALEEIATTEKPDVLVRHLPEEVQKRIEVLPNPQKQQVMEKLLAIKVEQLDGCTIRRADGVEAWEIVNQQGEIKGKVRLANAFTSGLESLLSLRFESSDGSQMFIVTMHLEGDDWRIDNFGAWENTALRSSSISLQNWTRMRPRLGKH